MYVDPLNTTHMLGTVRHTIGSQLAEDPNACLIAYLDFALAARNAFPRFGHV
jgi:hypothetical protein